MATVEATSKQVLALFGGVVAAIAGVVAILTPLVLGAARNEAYEAVNRQAEIDRQQFVTKAELSAVLRELDQIRGQLDRIEARVGDGHK
jgi:predicted cobalt transporter CbtA